MYGGTAIALRLGHRASVDFFSWRGFTPNTLMAEVPYVSGSTVRHSAPNTLTCTVERNGPVQVSFFGELDLGQVAPSEEVEGPGILVASLTDLAGTKIAVITQRAELKDYLDIHALMTQAGIPLPEMLAAAVAIYGEEFNPLLAMKALAYHDDPALADLSPDIRRDLIAAIPGVDPGTPTCSRGCPLPRRAPVKPLPYNDDILAIAPRVIWFEPPEKALADPVRFLAYLLTYGTASEVATVRRHLDADDLREALAACRTRRASNLQLIEFVELFLLTEKSQVQQNQWVIV